MADLKALMQFTLSVYLACRSGHIQFLTERFLGAFAYSQNGTVRAEWRNTVPESNAVL